MSSRTWAGSPVSGHRSPKTESRNGFGAPTGTLPYAGGRAAATPSRGVPLGTGPAAAGIGAGTACSSVSVGVVSVGVVSVRAEAAVPAVGAAEPEVVTAAVAPSAGAVANGDAGG